MMDRDRYKNKRAANGVKEGPKASAVPASKPEPKSETKPVAEESVKEQTSHEGIWVSDEKAEKLRLALLQVADMFGGDKAESESEKAPEKSVPKSEPKSEPTPELTPEREPEPEYVLHRDYDLAWAFKDASTGEVVYSRDILAVTAYAVDPYDISRVGVWLKDGKVVLPMNLKETRKFFPHLFLG